MHWPNDWPCEMARLTGADPVTFRSTGGCSTVELKPLIMGIPRMVRVSSFQWKNDTIPTPCIGIGSFERPVDTEGTFSATIPDDDDKSLSHTLYGTGKTEKGYW